MLYIYIHILAGRRGEGGQIGSSILGNIYDVLFVFCRCLGFLPFYFLMGVLGPRTGLNSFQVVSRFTQIQN